MMYYRNFLLATTVLLLVTHSAYSAREQTLHVKKATGAALDITEESKPTRRYGQYTYDPYRIRNTTSDSYSGVSFVSSDYFQGRM